jgi:serine phosphatase RsbU (regulator of sigma subunit)
VIVDAAFTCGTARLEDGEILLGYTDGVPEASSPGGAFFELARLMALLDSPADSADGLIRKIAGAVARHTGDGEQFDDITILAIRRAAAGPSVPGK